MLPCNVIVQEKESGQIEIAAVNPIASMQAVENKALGKVAQEIKGKLEKIISKL
jgi:uncharacterized protein (DUF302 family)